MKTQYLTSKQLSKAAHLLQEGQLVAFPTETIYALGAVASNRQALRQLYEIKQRPKDKALIVLFASQEEVENHFPTLTSKHKALMTKFWPGPLTIVLPVSDGFFASEVTAGKETVAVRVPGNSLTRQLIRKVGEPLVAPSANRSGQAPATTCEEIKEVFDDQIAAALCVSEEDFLKQASTIVELSSGGLEVLREGAIPTEKLLKGLEGKS